jgi:MFS family permease
MKHDIQRTVDGDPVKLWNRSYILVLLLGLVTGLSSQMVTPLVSKYAVDIGAPLTIAATISSLMSIAALVCRPISGAVTDLLNRKTLMIVTTIITGISIGCYALVENISVLIVMRTVHGVAFSFMSVANMAFSTSFIPKDRIGEGLGYSALAAIASQAAGPNLGYWLAENYNYKVCFMVSALLSIAAVVFMVMIPYEHIAVKREPGKKRFSWESLIAKELIVYTILISIFSMGNGLLNTYLALMAEERGIQNVTLFFTAYSIMLLLVRPVSGRLLDKKGIAAVLYPAFLIHSAGMIFVGAASKLWMLIAAGILKAIGQGSGTPSIQAHSVKVLGRQRAGVASSTTFIGQDLGNAIAPILGSFVAEKHGYGMMFYGYAAIVAVLGCSLIAIQRFIEKRREKNTAMER